MKLFGKQINIPLTICFTGGIITLAGELMGATNKEKWHTIS